MTVESTSRSYGEMADRWQTARDCVAGSHAIKDRNTTYLPALAGHNTRNPTDPYWAYLERALYYNATGRTIDGLVGMVFRRPPVVESPAGADDLVADVDLMGRTLEEFAKALLREVVTTGRAGILVDHTRAPAELRPYFRLYATEDILDVVEDVVGGAVVPVQVRLLECYQEPHGELEFETVEVRQIRVLELVDGRYRQRVFRQDASNQKFDEFEAVDPVVDGVPLDYIPFWVFGTDQVGRPGAIEPPPLIDLCDVNLAHYRQEADYRNGLHFAGIPTPYCTGMANPGEDMQLGSSQFLWFPPPDAKVGILSYDAGGMAAIRQSLDDLQQMMAFLGARMLQPEKRGIEAAETAQIHRQGEISILGSIANGINGHLTQALQFLLQWALFPNFGSAKIELNDDFIPTQAQPALLTAMVAAWQANAISHDSLWSFAQTGELVDPRRTVEEEQDLIKAEKPEPVAVVPPSANGAQPPARADQQPPFGPVQGQQAPPGAG